MPYDLDLKAIADGVWAWLDKHPGKVAEGRLVTIYRKAHKQAFTEFMQGGVDNNTAHSIRKRFGEAYGKLVTPRTPKYMKAVRKFYGGRYLPFTSPTKNGTGMNGMHLREAIRKPGGYRVTGRNGGGETITTSLYLSAARALNFHPQYRREFLALQSINRADGEAIEARVQEIALGMLRNEINTTERRRVRLARAAAREYAEFLQGSA
jgi:hypothetical protein